MMRIGLLAVVLHLGCVLPLRAQIIDVTHYKAEIEFTMIQEIIVGKAELTVRNADTSPITSLTLDLVNLNTEEVEVSGEKLAFQQSGGDLTVTLASPLATGDSLVMEISYSGHPVPEPGPAPWGGCFWNLDGVTFSMGVGFFADYVSMMRHWLPSHDIPSDKATFDITFTVPEGFVVAATGVLTSSETLNGFTRYRWVENHQTATYLFNYAISDYVRILDDWQGIPMEYYVRRKDSVKGTSYFTTIPDIMDAYTARFGPYPFDKVGYCLTPIGAMEHQTMISYDQDSFDRYTFAGSTAAHELAHMWWGDWVTPEDFREAWLSEGFAVFSELVYQEHMGGRIAYVDAAFSIGRNYKSTVASVEGVFQLYDFPRTPPSSNYPKTIYQKGGAVLVMLREVMGEDAFFKGLREYSQTYRYGNVTTAKFQAVMEQHFGASLDWFFNEWVYDKGWPDYTFEVLKDAGNPLRIRVLQTQDNNGYPPFKMPIPFYAVTHSLDTVRMTMVNDAMESQVFEFPSLPSDSVLFVRIDPERLILSRQNTRTVGAATLPASNIFSLSPLYPNPSSRGTTVTVPFSVASSTGITVTVYDAIGRQIMTIAEKTYAPGTHTISLRTDSLAIGCYWVYVTQEYITQIQNIVVR